MYVKEKKVEPSGWTTACVAALIHEEPVGKLQQQRRDLTEHPSCAYAQASDRICSTARDVSSAPPRPFATFRFIDVDAHAAMA